MPWATERFPDVPRRCAPRPAAPVDRRARPRRSWRPSSRKPRVAPYRRPQPQAPSQRTCPLRLGRPRCACGFDGHVGLPASSLRSSSCGVLPATTVELVHLLGTFVRLWQFGGGRCVSFWDFCTPRAAIRRDWTPSTAARGIVQHHCDLVIITISAGQRRALSRCYRPHPAQRQPTGRHVAPNPLPRVYKTREKTHWGRLGMPRAYKTAKKMHMGRGRNAALARVA